MSEEELSTKEKIINATFSLLKTQFFSTISLSKIAKEVNISKTAIYRHFENKEALEIALKNKIFEDMLVLLRNVDELYDSKDYDGCICSVLRFIRQYPEYLNYGFFSVSELGEDKELYQFRDAGIRIFNCFFDENHKIKDFSFYLKALFVIVTMIDLMLSWFGSCDHCPDVKKIRLSYDEYEKYILKVIKEGLSFENPLLEPAQLGKIDSLCLESMKKLPPLDKKLVALGNVVLKVGFQNVTVEAIADELGMVKSSLYTWFSDKQQMIKSLVSPEINMMLGCIVENVNALQSPAEKLYAILKTETLYFNTRRKMLSACKWIQISGNYSHEDYDAIVDQELSLRMKSDVEKMLAENCHVDLSAVDIDLLIGWIFSIPVFLVVNAIHHEFSEEETNQALIALYNMTAGGLTFGRDLNIKGGSF